MTHPQPQSRTLESLVVSACVLEACAPKPGNVHPGQAFDDVCFDDFVTSAKAIGPILQYAADQGVGLTIFRAVEATHAAVGFNTNLGIVLLLAPLAAVPLELSLPEGIGSVLNPLSVDDAKHTYSAIRLASPGGLNNATEEDVQQPPTQTLTECMRLAADRDLIARQYVTNFETVLRDGIQFVDPDRFADDSQTEIVRLQLQLMSHFPDSLIARKMGVAEADESSRGARRVLDRGWPHSSTADDDLRELDAWLRAKGNSRNPGTTADLIAAILFAAFRDDHLPCPSIDFNLS